MSDCTIHDSLTDPVVVTAAKALHAAHEARVRTRYPYGAGGSAPSSFVELPAGFADEYLYRGRDVVRSLQLADGDGSGVADEAVKYIVPRFFGPTAAVNDKRRAYARQAAIDVLDALSAAGLSL